MRRRLRDSEGAIFLDSRLLFFDAADVAPARTLVEHSGQLIQFCRGTDCIHLDAPVIEIAGVAGKSEFDGGALGEIAIPHTLDAPTNIPSLRVTGRFGHAGLFITTSHSVAGRQSGGPFYIGGRRLCQSVCDWKSRPIASRAFSEKGAPTT